jgi:F-type H+-transporting ATPase subunit epsilon
MSELKCIVVTPEGAKIEQPAEFVALPLVDGEIGIAPGRAPLIGRLSAGELRIMHEEKISRYYAESGFVEVVDDKVTLLANRVIPAKELDAAVLEQQLARARARSAVTPDEIAQRDRALELFRAQLRVARRAGDETPAREGQAEDERS